VIEIEISGFQSIEHISMCVEGFTALVGRSNIGKSAIVRAVKAALTGAVGTSFVRHDTTCARRLKGQKTCKCKASVHIKAEGLDLLWEKGDAINAYKVNGRDLNALERGYPEFLVPHGFAPVKLGENQELIQVSDQFSPPFLLRESGATVANLLSDVARLDAVNLATKLVEKDRREAASLRKTRDKDVLDLKAKLVAFDGLDDAANGVGEVEERLQRMQEVDGKIRLFDGYITTLTEGKREMLALAVVEKVVIPDPAGLTETQTKLLDVTRFHASALEQSTAIKAMQPLEKVNIPDPSGLATKWQSLVDVGLFQDRLEESQSAEASIAVVEAVFVPEITALARATESLGRFGTWLDRMRTFKAWFEDRRGIDQLKIPDPTILTEKANALDRVSTLAEKYRTLTNGVAALDKEIAELQAELTLLEAEVDALGICPTCTRPLHEGGHAKVSHGSDLVHLQD
jgi:hypothetical protein